MPYAMRELPDGFVEVFNSDTGTVHSKHTTHAKAMAQLRLLRGIEHGSIVPHGARDKEHFTAEKPKDPNAPDITKTPRQYRMRKAAGVVPSGSPHDKQLEIRKTGAAPPPKDKGK